MPLTAAALSFSAGAVAQSTAPPDLQISEWGNIVLPMKDRVFRTSVSNIGGQAATVEVTYYRGSVHPGNATVLHTQMVTIGPRSGVSVTGPTVTTNDGDVFSVCADPKNAIKEPNENNNCQVRVIAPTSADLAVDTADIRITPVGANVGEPIQVYATVRNRKNVNSRALVRLFQSHPNGPGAKQLAVTQMNVSANGSGAAMWTITRPAGDTNLFVSVDDVYPYESDHGDNISSRNVFLKTIIDTGRIYSLTARYATYPAIGDLLGSGVPVMVFGEHQGSSGPSGAHARVTVVQAFTDGSWKEVWSKQLLPAPSRVFSPVLADLDNDDAPEIIVQALRRIEGNPDTGEIYVFALKSNGDIKWQHKWSVPRSICHTDRTTEAPAVGDMNNDGVADVVYAEKEVVIIDGRNGAEMHRNANPSFSGCSGYRGLATIADLDGDGKNEYILGRGHIQVFNSDATLRYRLQTGSSNYALADVEKDGKAEIVVPRYRTRFDMFDAATGAFRKQVTPTGWSPNDRTIAATTSLDPAGLPSFAVANNDAINGTGVLDSQMNVKWWKIAPANEDVAFHDNPEHVLLADLLGLGVPQIITRSDARGFGIQDIRDGSYYLHTSIFGYGSMGGGPIVADVDGDGRAEVVLLYGGSDFSGVQRQPYEPRLSPVQFLVFSSEHWAKVPGTWNSIAFVPGQVDRKLAFRHDYQPWKTHNTWFQQPLRMACDVDYDFDVDQNDISLIFAARDKKVQPGDWRDIDKDGTITVADGRACTVKCTQPNCAAINLPPRILAVSPRTARPGSTLDVTVRGEGVNFRAGQTILNFGAGITVGPVTVLDGETAKARITIPASMTGTRPVTVTTGAITASRQDALVLSTGNLPPVVSASVSATRITHPAPVALTGTVSDDGMPNGTLSRNWQVVAGPGNVTIADAGALTTSASFSQPGFYHLRLSATDGQYVASSDVGVTVIRGNEAPAVNAGADLTAFQNTGAHFAAEVADDGLPAGMPVSMAWSKVSGPGNVTFTPANSVRTHAMFSSPGEYVLRLTASDTQMQGTDEVTVTVNPPIPQILSVAPDSAVAGQQRTVTLKAKYGKFIAGVTEANFGPGVSVGGAAAGAFGKVTVLDEDTATVQLSVIGGAALGARTVAVRTNASQGTKANAFHVGTIGVPHSVRLNLSDRAIAPGDSITAAPEVVDAAGNIIAGPHAFTMTVTPKPGLTTGSAPQVNAMTATFPKLVKRLLNHDVTKDPEGRWTDGDPAGPNYGKETGGLYTLTVTLNATAVKGMADIAVIPSGTAEITTRVQRLAADLNNTLEAARQGFATATPAVVTAARGQLTNVLANRDYSLPLLATNHVLAPPNGFPVTTAQIAGRFPSSPDDAAFGKALEQHIAHLAIVRTRIEQINPAAPTQADVDALRSALNAYRTMTDQVAAMKPSPVGVVQHGRLLNTLFRRELPQLLDVTGRKSLAILNSVDGVPVTVKADAFVAASVHANAFPTDALLNIYSELFSVFTDFSTYARAQCIELGISLANSLVNIALANALNELSPGGLAVDFAAGGAQFSFICPRYPNSYVEGRGFSSNLEDNSVAVIGCLNSNALRTMLTMSPVKDMAAAIRLMFDIKSLADAFSGDAGIAANAEPDFMRDGFFSGGTQMVFRQGWPKVNQGRIPCVGVIIAFNLESGSFHSANANMLPACE